MIDSIMHRSIVGPLSGHRSIVGPVACVGPLSGHYMQHILKSFIYISTSYIVMHVHEDALVVTGLISMSCIVGLFYCLRNQCLYWMLRYEIYQLNIYLQRRTNVTIVPVDHPPVETVIVIQNPNDISLGYISKDKS